MSHGYKPIPVLPDERQRSALSDDLEYWLRMKETAVFQQTGIVSSVAFTPTNPYHMAATHSNQVTMLDTSISQPVWLQKRFKSNVHGMRFRKDGKLLGMGSEDGYVHFIDVQARNIPSKHSIRVFQAHSSAVRALVFTSAANVCATCGDDGDLKLWDLALSDATEPLWHCVGAHKDRIRTATAGNSEHLIVTGSYDHLVKLWDTRRSANAAAASIHLDHGHPIESILLHPNDRVIVSAGGNVVKFWDIANAARGPLATLENHNRTVTSLCFSTQCSFLLTGGLDRRINTYRIDRGDYEFVNTMLGAAPVLAIAMAPNDECLGFGMNNLLCIHRRHPKFSPHVASDDSKRVLIGDGELKSARSTKGVPMQKEKAGEPIKVDVITSNRHLDQIQLGRFDKLMRSYKYRAVVDELFSKSQKEKSKPHIVVATLEQLRLSQSLNIALSGRQGKELSAIVDFLCLNLFTEAYFSTLFAAAEALIAMYVNVKLTKDELSAFRHLQTNIRDEILSQRALLQSAGVIDTLLGQWTEQRRRTTGATVEAGDLGDLLITPKLSCMNAS